MKKHIRILFFTFLVCSPLYPEQWQHIGLEERQITCIQADPRDESVIFTGCFNVGQEGGLYKSMDGGITWELILLGNGAVWDVDFDPITTDMMYACSDRIYKSVDKGKNWFWADSGTVAESRKNGRFDPLVINPTQPNKMIASYTYGVAFRTFQMYKSDDGGKNWHTFDFPIYNASVLKADPFSKNTIYAAPRIADDAFKSKDFGENWEQWQNSDQAGSVSDIKIFKIDSLIYHVLLRHGTGFYISIDGGDTWEQQSNGLPQSYYFHQICLVDSILYICGHKILSYISGVYKKHINGNNWELVGSEEDFNGAITRVLHYSKYYKKLFVGTDNGVFSQGISSNVKIQKQYPNSFQLKQNYPNPFNGSTVIEYELKKQTEVSLDLYDINGKWIKNIVNERGTPGIHKVNLSLNNHASGVYFYKFKGGENEIVKKLLLVR